MVFKPGGAPLTRTKNNPLLIFIQSVSDKRLIMDVSELTFGL